MDFKDKIMLQCPPEIKCHQDCSLLNPGPQGERLTSQLLWVVA